MNIGAHTTLLVGERTTFRSCCIFFYCGFQTLNSGHLNCAAGSFHMRHLVSTDTALFSENNFILVTLKMVKGFFVANTNSRIYTFSLKKISNY